MSELRRLMQEEGMQLVWKKGLPTEVGWYWFRNRNLKITTLATSTVDKKVTVDPARPTMWYIWSLDICHYSPLDIKEGEWAGPIPLPEEQKEVT